MEELDGAWNVVARGRQRARVRLPSSVGQPFDSLRAPVDILPDPPVSRVPADFREGRCHWGAWATRSFDAYYLADLAKRRLAGRLPAAAGYAGGPRELSYWLAANLPVDCSAKQVQSIVQRGVVDVTCVKHLE